ncbi:spermidine/putrescine ABC transporter substrate-binding protein [Vibrio sp. RE86]|uniref:polyamine ABC transporter substrate-binding protein n=1 Tax=Vibrio sp. RE86 TaxID=2607605 RepID=UPI0014939AE5|nr:spermidine/putrescine ABC transporter substrate-binding protein [Vibrio sp. RE86]NOH79808.1 spermidine/putrescine ABC transporter substrate-binding protein [Vibrio sp. RE86]
MKNKYLKLAAMAAGLLNISYANANLHIYMWEDSIAESVLSRWESENSQTIQSSYFDNDDERNKLMLNSQKLPFDIITLDNVSAGIYGNDDTLVRLDDLPNTLNNDKRWTQACGDYAVPYFWGALGLAYRKSKFEEAPASWKTITSPTEELKGHIGMLADTVETLLPSLLTMGYAGNTSSPYELKKAYEHTLEQLTDFLTFEYAISYIRTTANPQDLHIAMAYSGDQFALNNFLQEGDWAFVIPDEGSSIWVDCLAINSVSPNIEQAKKFLNYLMDAQIAALNAEEIGVATPNLAAYQYLPKTYLEDKTLFPSQEVLDKSYIDQRLSSANSTLRTKVIKTILKKYETQH